MKKIFSLMKFLIILLGFYLFGMISFDNMSLFFLLSLLIVFFKYTNNFKQDRTTILFSLLFSLMIVLGSINKFGSNNVLYLFIKFLATFFLFERILFLFKSLNLKLQNDNKEKQKISKKKFIIISMIVGFLFFLPYFFKFFPAIITPDSHDQLLQVYGLKSFSNHHPWLHTLIIKLFYSVGYFLTKKEIIGVAFYVIFQIITMCFIYSYTVYTLYKKNINKWIIVVVWIYFFINPFNGIYAVTIWKDILFSGVMLLFTVFIVDSINETWNKKQNVCFVILSTLVCLFVKK